MDIRIVTLRPQLPTNQLFAAACAAQKCRWGWKSPRLPLGEPPRLALIRLGLTALEEGLKLARQYEQLGTRVINSPAAIAIAKDKWQTYKTLSGLPQVATRKQAPGPNLNAEYPLILKTRYGTKGAGVHLVHTPEEHHQVAAIYHDRGYDVLLQPYLEGAEEWRVLLWQDEVLASARRQPAPGEFRANWHQGGTLQISSTPDELTSLATNALLRTGLQWGAVDLMIHKQGPQILEINDSAGLVGLTEASGQDLAGAVIKRLTR